MTRTRRDRQPLPCDPPCAVPTPCHCCLKPVRLRSAAARHARSRMRLRSERAYAVETAVLSPHRPGSLASACSVNIRRPVDADRACHAAPLCRGWTAYRMVGSQSSGWSSNATALMLQAMATAFNAGERHAVKYVVTSEGIALPPPGCAVGTAEIASSSHAHSTQLRNTGDRCADTCATCVHTDQHALTKRQYVQSSPSSNPECFGL